MNTTGKTDFFPEISEQDAPTLAPDIYRSFQDTEEDLLREQRLKEAEANLGGSEPADGWGDLPYDAESDRKR